MPCSPHGSLRDSALYSKIPLTTIYSHPAPSGTHWCVYRQRRDGSDGRSSSAGQSYKDPVKDKFAADSHAAKYFGEPVCYQSEFQLQHVKTKAFVVVSSYQATARLRLCLLLRIMSLAVRCMQVYLYLVYAAYTCTVTFAV